MMWLYLPRKHANWRYPPTFFMTETLMEHWELYIMWLAGWSYWFATDPGWMQ